MLNKTFAFIFFILITTRIFAQKEVVTPTPPINYTGNGVKTTYSSETYNTPEKGIVLLQFWVTTYEEPKYLWIVKQAHLSITPPPGADIEDYCIWLYKPNEFCVLMDWQPKLRSSGITLKGAFDLTQTIGTNLTKESMVDVDGTQIEVDASYLEDIKNDGYWFIDWTDYSDAASSPTTLDFYAKWKCPKKCDCKVQDASNSLMSVEFDISGFDVEYSFFNGKVEDKSKTERKEVEKTASVWTPPTGETRIAVVGTVQDEKVMMTSRGGSIGGTVTLETEEGEELAVVEPDEEGHFAIDFRDTTALTVASTLVITQLDSEGNEETSTTVEYEPGTPPEWIGPPIIEEPEVSYMENNQLYDIKGSNLGERAEVIIIDEQGETILQETVSSSMSRTQFYLDAPIGPAKMQVRNDFGSTEPIETGIYEFDVWAGKMNLVKNENTNITANYDGLPEGTKIIFTNLSENVAVSPNGNGKALRNEITFIAEESTGEVSMTLTARQAGGWSLNYRLEFPVLN